MNIKACLFDLDGVLVDTARFHYLAWKELAVRLGFDFTEADNERLKGVSRMDSLEILLQIGKVALSEKEKITYAEEKNERYLGFVLAMTPEDALPGAREFLAELKKTKILTGLGSASKNARIILEKTNLVPYFDAIVDGTLVKRAKPHPEVFELGARMLRTYPPYCVVFEDAVAGITAAHKAGMKCIGVGSSDILHEADLVIPGFGNFTYENLVYWHNALFL
jgi:beta-phosphoglucomutase